MQAAKPATSGLKAVDDDNNTNTGAEDMTLNSKTFCGEAPQRGGIDATLKTTGDTMIKSGDELRILPQWQDEGDDNYRRVAIDDESDGRVTVATFIPGMSIHPTCVMDAMMLVRWDNLPRQIRIELRDKQSAALAAHEAMAGDYKRIARAECK